MVNIRIKNYIDGDTAVSYDQGLDCKKAIEEKLGKEDKIILDFSGVSYVITAFLNPIIGDLILEHGKGVMKFIGIQDANNSIIEKIKLVKDGALMKREDMDE